MSVTLAPGEAPVAAPACAALDVLTRREQEVLRLLAAGWSNSAISDALCVSPKTLETHLRHVYAKLDLPQTGTWHRRVLAARAWMDAQGEDELLLLDLR
jgi:DNA-binding NarL/FixJ family response regulator